MNRRLRNTPYATHNTPSSTGFTLVELLVVLAILTLVTGALVGIFYQIFKIPRWGNAQMAVDSDLRNAGLWLVRDANESVQFTGTTGSCVPFTFTTSSRLYGYTLNGNTLERHISGSGNIHGIARHVSEITCPAGAITGTVAVTLKAQSGEVSHSTTYTLTMRVQE